MSTQPTNGVINPPSIDSSQPINSTTYTEGGNNTPQSDAQQNIVSDSSKIPRVTPEENGGTGGLLNSSVSESLTNAKGSDFVSNQSSTSMSPASYQKGGKSYKSQKKRIGKSYKQYGKKSQKKRGGKTLKQRGKKSQKRNRK
jgi:hypothetical protein